MQACVLTILCYTQGAEDPNPASEYQVFEDSHVVDSTCGNELVQVQKRHKPGMS